MLSSAPAAPQMLAPSAQWTRLDGYIHPDPRRAAEIADRLAQQLHRHATDPSIQHRYLTAHLAATHDRIRPALSASS